VRQDEREPFVEALETARLRAYPNGEYVGQESFMPASEILLLARRAGIGAATTVLDLCCGAAGPGRLITERTGCEYVGVDYSDSALAIARERTRGLPCRFVTGQLPPLPADLAPPPGGFDVALLLETLLAFGDKPALLRAVAAALGPGGRFGLTVEAGEPLTAAERANMPDADTVHPVPFQALRDLLADAGLTLTWWQETTAEHLAIAAALHDAYRDAGPAAIPLIGTVAHRELVAAHRLWVDWLASGRVRKFAVVAERSAPVS
jgi:sarcosine/dimethylglycine N-methyltransferase